MKNLGFINVNNGWKWLKSLESKLEKERWNKKENSSGRKCLWFGLGVELGFKNNIFKGEKINNGLKKRCDELWNGEDWNSILIYKYGKGVGLKDHIDRNIFDSKVVIINFCKDLMSGFRYDGNIYWLRNGEVIEIDNKKRHGVCKVSEERWSVSIRKVK